MKFIYIGFAVFLLLFYLYLLFKKRVRRIAEEKLKKEESARPSANETARQRLANDMKVKREAAPVAAPAQPVKPLEEAKITPPEIPQDSTLRRHYISHLRYMIESVTFPQPTDSVLRRHYEQLIASEMDACLADGARMNKLIGEFDAVRKKALSA